MAVMYQMREKSFEAALFTWKIEQTPPKLSNARARAILFLLSKKESAKMLLRPVVTSKKQEQSLRFWFLIK